MLRRQISKLFPVDTTNARDIEATMYGFISVNKSATVNKLTVYYSVENCYGLFVTLI